jgi:hypothetical protein
MPVTGTRDLKINNRGYGLDKTWTRQTKPYQPRLPYVKRENIVLSYTGIPIEQVYLGLSMPMPSGTDQGRSDAYNKAYAKFKDKVGARSEWAVSVAERVSAVNMIANRLGQVARFTRYARKGWWTMAANELGMIEDPRTKKIVHSTKKEWASKYLEFHFGWSPLVSDIYSSIEILSREFPVLPIRGRGEVFRDVIVGNLNSDFSRWRHTQKCQIIADLRIENPNILLLSQLGLVNPASVAWELVPFSFVVDWFVNVGDVLAAWTDFVGVSLSNIAITYTREGEFEQAQKTYFQNSQKWAYFEMQREAVGSLPGPTFKVRPWNGFSIRRGLAAASLLIQLLPARSTIERKAIHA